MPLVAVYITCLSNVTFAIDNVIIYCIFNVSDNVALLRQLIQDYQVLIQNSSKLIFEILK